MLRNVTETFFWLFVFLQVCGKSFNRMYNLLGHMHLHAGSKPFKCPYCTSKFNLKGNLSRHMKVKHGMDVSPEGQGEDLCTHFQFNFPSIFIKQTSTIEIQLQIHSVGTASHSPHHKLLTWVASGSFDVNIKNCVKHTLPLSFTCSH